MISTRSLFHPFTRLDMRIAVVLAAPAAVVLSALVLLALPAWAAPDDGLPVAPRKKPDGGPWRIGYLEGGPYSHYPATLKATVQALADLGWCGHLEFPPAKDQESAAEVWNILATQLKSDFLRFPADAFHGGDWGEGIPREGLRDTVLTRLNATRDLDLVIAMGTWAGQDLAASAHGAPVVVLSASDPLGAGIIKSVDDSGQDNLHARIDPERYQRQVRLFHDIIGFKRLGLVYEDTVAGRSYAALDDVRAVAAERGFEIIPCVTPLDLHSGPAFRNLLACHRQLAGKVDAVYLTENNGMQLHRLPALLEPLHATQTPTFAMSGSDEVRHGVMLSIAQAGFKYVGEFHARTIARILNGAMPRRLTQRFEEPPKIAINLQTAERVGFNPPVDILMAADEMFETTAVAPEPPDATD